MSKQQYLILLSCLFLFMGIGRIFSLVTNDPILGYANNYEMIRLQACHQIWPADKFVDITTGTPSAPLRRYTLEKHVNTPCFPSSELLFTSIGIELGKLKNKITGESLISIKTIGFVKATFLSLTVLLASIFFYHREMYGALLANALITLAVLSDPGVTLYMNTFYTEFSAVYFLYLTLVGIVALAKAKFHFSTVWIFLIGLIGFGLSEPQYIISALLLGVLIICWIATQRVKFSLLLLILCAALTPFSLQISGNWMPHDASITQSQRVNVMGALLAASSDHAALLKALDLPAHCTALTGKNWLAPEVQQQHVCNELSTISKADILFNTAIHQPHTLLTMAYTNIPKLRQWLYPLYGQVEGRSYGSGSDYRRSIGTLLIPISLTIFNAIWLLPLFIFLIIVVFSFYKKYISYNILFATFLVFLQWLLFTIPLYNNGIVDLAKHTHLAICLCLSFYIALICVFVSHSGAAPPNCPLND